MTQTLPRFSFLTPAYQTEAYLAQTIESVIGQTASDWELVVVDNGRSEMVADIVGSYAQDPRIVLVRQENRGYAGGVMAAATVAQGEFLCVLDSDDLLVPDFVRVIGGFLDAHPTVDAVGCDAHQFLDGDRHSFGRGYLHSTGTGRPARTGQRLSVEEVLRGRVPYYTAAFRRQAWDLVGGYEPGVPGIDESVLIWLRLADGLDVRLIPDRLARYRVRETSLSRDPRSVEDFEDSLMRTFEVFAQESGKPDNLRAVETTLRRLRYHQALRRARWAFVDGDVPTARRFAGEAYAQRRTVRAAAMVGSLTAAPRATRVLYPLKQRFTLTRPWKSL